MSATKDHLMELEVLVARDTEIGGLLALLEDERKAIRAQLLEVLPVGSTTICGLKVNITTPSRWTTASKAEFAAKYPVVSYPSYYEAVVNTKAVEADLSPNALAEFKQAGLPQLSIRS